MSETLTPVFRLEYFITAAANGTPCDLEPIFNEEKYLHAIAGASVDLPMPIGRTQEYLAKLAGMDVEIPDKPIYRTEYYLAHMIDSTVECPAPVFREEMFYYEWASNEYVTIVGNPVSFTAIAAPLKQLSVAFSPKQDLHGYDAPWPAGGGVNKFGLEFIQNTSFTLVGGYYRSDVPICKAGTYKWTGYAFASSVSALAVRLNDLTNQPFFIVSNNTMTPTANLTFDGDVYLEINYTIAGFLSVVTECKGQLELGSTATAYAPYSNICPILGWDSVTVYHSGADTSNPQTISITIGQTVYSGTVDVLTGVVTVDRGSLVVDGETSLSVASNLICNIASQFKGMASAEVGLYKSDTFKAHINSGVANMNNEFTVDGYHMLIVKAPSLFTTTAEAKAYFTANPTKFVAPLATPQTIQLTPQQVSSLLGENNMWSDANGDLTVEYRSN